MTLLQKYIKLKKARIKLKKNIREVRGEIIDAEVQKIKEHIMDNINIYSALLWIFCFICLLCWFTTAAEFSPEPYNYNEMTKYKNR